MITLQTQSRFNNYSTPQNSHKNDINFGTGIEAVVIAGVMSGLSFWSGLKIGESTKYRDSLEISQPIKAIQDTSLKSTIIKDSTKIKGYRFPSF